MFDRQKEREGAYDFLENDAVDAAALANSVFAATVRRAQGEAFVYVAIDGSSLTLTDGLDSKGFGPIGSPNAPVNGVMEMGALAVTREGVPLGLVDQTFWARDATEVMPDKGKTKRNKARPFEEKEPYYFALAAKNAHERLAAVGTQAWVLIDREGDSRDILLALHKIGCCFTVRANWNRSVRDQLEPSVQEALDSEPVLGAFMIEVPRNGKRSARTATLEVRAAQVTLKFRKDAPQSEDALRLFAVRVRERGGKDGELEWLLYTNVPVVTAEHAKEIVDGYRARWRIEEFHRTWKQGECNVEDSQLRSFDAMVRWATVLAAVATRIERLKYLSRAKPNEPATIELVEAEIEALKLDQRRRTTRKIRLPKMPTIAEATHWIAELGGWLGPRNGPPGSVTISRGLERLGYLVEGIAMARGRRDPAT